MKKIRVVIDVTSDGGREGGREGHEEALSGRKIEEKEAYSRKAICNVQLMRAW